MKLPTFKHFLLRSSRRLDFKKKVSHRPATSTSTDQTIYTLSSCPTISQLVGLNHIATCGDTLCQMISNVHQRTTVSARTDSLIRESELASSRRARLIPSRPASRVDSLAVALAVAAVEAPAAMTSTSQARMMGSLRVESQISV